MNMFNWLSTAAQQKKAMPILSFPGHQMTGKTVRELVNSSDAQADCMKAIADRYDTLAAVTLMDLSVEAEAFGSKIKFDDKDVPTVTEALVHDEDEADALKIPKVGDARTGLYVDVVPKALKKITDRPVFAGVIGPFSLAGRLMDVSEIMVLAMVEPDMVRTVLEKVSQFSIEYIKAYKAAGAHGIVMAEPVAGLLSPQLIAEFSCPYVKRIAEAVEDENFLVMYHNCGSVMPLAQAIFDTGIRAFHFGNIIDLGEMAKIVPPDRIFMGNVDPAGAFCNGTPESIRRDTLKVLEACSKYPNFIVSSGCDIPPQSPLANIDSFFATVREYDGR